MPIVMSPLTNYLLVALEPDVEQSKVIQVVRHVEGLARFGTVTAVGPEVRDVKPGQRVLASITAGVELGERVVMIAESAVLGHVHE
jgi:NADPH:quinone reductase-like Zn-dependent oxidoreductase